MVGVDCAKKETANCPVNPDNYRDMVQIEDWLPAAWVSFRQMADHEKTPLGQIATRSNRSGDSTGIKPLNDRARLATAV